MAQAKGLEQALIKHYGGARSQNPNTSLFNEYRSYDPAKNPNASVYDSAVTDELLEATLKKVDK